MSERYLTATVRWRVPEGVSPDHLEMAKEQLFSQENDCRQHAFYIANCTLFEGWPVSVEVALADENGRPDSAISWAEAPELLEVAPPDDRLEASR